jgi:DNA primase catalytic core
MAKTDLKTVVAQIKQAYLISDYIRNSGVKLTAAGPGKWKGLCSFHNEKTPSFNVNDQFGNYHCFGCSAHGDIIKYIQETEHLEFMDVVRKLAEEKGIELDLEKGDGPAVDYKSLRECLKETANFFAREYRKLPADHKARKQVTDRGISEKGMVYGYAPEKRTALYEHLKSKDFSEEIMLQAGVVSYWEKNNRYSDFWTGRLMFVITDVMGRPIGFAGRKLFEDDTRGKFVNSPAGPLFDKSSALFNIQNAKKPSGDAKEVYVAEGQFDVAAFIEAGSPNVVASSGTAFTHQQGGILQRLVGESGKVIFAFDGDAAGIGAAKKVFKNVPSLHSNSWVVQFPEGKDPCDYRLDNGNEKFQEHVAKRVPLVEFILDVTKGDHDMTSTLGRAKYLEDAAKVLKTIASNTVREQFVRKVALDTFTEVGEVKAQVEKSDALELADEDAPNHNGEEVAEGKEDNDGLELTDSVDLLELIRSDQTYALAARFLALAVLDSELIQYLPKNKKRLPTEFNTVIDELCALQPGAIIIPEAFTDSKLVQYLSNPRYFPLAHLESFNTREQFEYVYKRYMAALHTTQEAEIQGKIHMILASAEDNQLELLVQALETEERLLREAKIGA